MTIQKTAIQKPHYSKRDYKAFWYLLPWIIGFIVLQLYPFIMSFVYSFCDYTVGSNLNFIGLDNYKELFTHDREFWNSLKVTVLFALYTVPGKVILALLVAMFLNRNIKGINLVRTLYYIPSLFGGSVAIALLWRLMFMNNGVFNTMMTKLGLPNISFLGDTKMALPTICLLEIWQFGSSMVMLLAALKNVPKELYEAADVDGGGKWAKFWHITLPQISPILFFAILNQMIQELQNFTSPYTITGGGPLKSTNVLGIMLYKQGFGYFKMGYASAISWIEFVLILAFTLFLFGTSKFWVHYADET
jgi:oligogalacturonide transport system permease protein